MYATLNRPAHLLRVGADTRSNPGAGLCISTQVAEMQTQMKRAGEDREMENSDFQKTVSDQREGACGHYSSEQVL